MDQREDHQLNCKSITFRPSVGGSWPCRPELQWGEITESDSHRVKCPTSTEASPGWQPTNRQVFFFLVPADPLPCGMPKKWKGAYMSEPSCEAAGQGPEITGAGLFRRVSVVRPLSGLLSLINHIQGGVAVACLSSFSCHPFSRATPTNSVLIRQGP
jgi:hypothetical protein